jgi:hypothetical protein
VFVLMSTNARFRSDALTLSYPIMSLSLVPRARSSRSKVVVDIRTMSNSSISKPKQSKTTRRANKVEVWIQHPTFLQPTERKLPGKAPFRLFFKYGVSRRTRAGVLGVQKGRVTRKEVLAQNT